MDWDTILGGLGVFGIAVAVLGWLARTIFLHWLDKDVSKYRVNLQAAHDVEMEKLRNDLRLRSIEHEIRFRSIHERQATVLCDVYGQLTRLHRAVVLYLADIEPDGCPSKTEKLKTVTEIYEGFRECFYPNRILLPQATGDSVMTTGNKFAEATTLYARAIQSVEAGHPARSQTDWLESVRIMEKEIPLLLTQLQKDFQELLGVASTNEGNAKESGTTAE